MSGYIQNVYKVEFIVDDGYTEEKHIAIINAENIGEAISKFHKYIDPKLNSEEIVKHALFNEITNTDILYCNFKGDKDNE